MKTLQELSRDFWAMMTDFYESNLLDKRNSDTMRVVAMLLDTVKVLDAEAFMERFGTTFGSDIYVPWKPGEGDDEECWMQITTCVHEHMHVVQSRRDGLLLFSGRYLLDASLRARYEAEAYRTNLELEFWRRGHIPRGYQPENISRVLDSYGCDQNQIQFMRKYLELSVPEIEQGKILSSVSQIAIEWLNAHAPHIRSVK